MKISSPLLQRTLLGLCILALALGLAAYSATGSFARLWADDYCYSSAVRQYGVLQGTAQWYNISGSRFSAIPLVALVDLFGVWGVRLFPAWVLWLWALAGAALLRALAERQCWKLNGAWVMYFGLLLAFFAAYLAPDRLQTVYWRMGIIHYSLPVPLLLLLLTVLLIEPRNPSGWQRAKRAAGFFLAALFIGGFSETFAALMVGVLVLLMLALLLNGQRSRDLFTCGGAALLGTLAAMAIMALSPSNAWRQAALPPPDSLGQLISYTLRYSAAFLVDSFVSQPLPNFVFAALAAGAAFMAGGPGLGLRRALTLGLMALAGMILLVICATAPSVYGGLASPAGRALMPSRFVVLAGLGTCAALAGLTLRGWIETRTARLRLVQVLVLAGMVIFSLYPLRGAALLLTGETQTLAVKAARWDARHSAILEDAAAGTLHIQTVETDVVQGLVDIGPDPDDWVNACAAGYYGVESITAKVP